MSGNKADMSLEHQLELAISGLTNDFKRWDTVYKEGTFDPTYTDGFNLSLVRNRIVNNKTRIEALCSELGCEIPEIYFRDTPPEIDRDYMAKADDIRLKARIAYVELSKSSYYKELLTYENKLSIKQLESICFFAVKGYVTRLAEAINKDNLVSMRLYIDWERYIESFKNCLERAKKFVPEPVQLTFAEF